MVFPVIMYSCKSWTIKKTEHWRIDAFELWCWGRCLRVPWTARRPSQSILREINPEYSLEGPKLKLAEAENPVFWSSDAYRWLIGKVPDAGKDWGQKEKKASEDEMAGWHYQCNGHELGQTSGDGERQGGLVCCSPWGSKDSDTTGWLNIKQEFLPWGFIWTRGQTSSFDQWTDEPSHSGHKQTHRVRKQLSFIYYSYALCPQNWIHDNWNVVIWRVHKPGSQCNWLSH